MQNTEKQERIAWLYKMLDKCGQMIAEDDEWGADRRYFNREYRSIMKELAKLEPEKWKDFKELQKPSERYDGLVSEFCKTHKCPKCGGEIKQTRSGSLCVKCCNCNSKYKLKTKKR